MKPAKTLDEQVQIFVSRGLSVADAENTKSFLHNVSYYRFAGYTHLFQVAPGSGGDDAFRPGTTFEQIQRRYVFDQNLREAVWLGISEFEISFKARFAYLLGTQLGATSYLVSNNFRNHEHFDSTTDQIETDLKRSKEKFVRAYFRNHPSEDFPVWMAFEATTLGVVSKILSNLDAPKLVAQLANGYGLNAKHLPAIVQIMTLVRNACAHHGRLWQREFSAQGPSIQYPVALSRRLSAVDNRSTYWALLALNHLLVTTSPDSTFGRDITSILQTDSSCWTGYGIPDGTQAEDLF